MIDKHVIRRSMTGMMAALLFAGGAARADDSQADDVMARRIKSAQDLIVKGEALKSNMQKLHHAAENQIAQATKLKGEAEYLHSNMPTNLGPAKLSAEQAKAASKQYISHLTDFDQHAAAYQGHLKDFETTLGECHANETAYQQFAKEYTMHIDQFHAPELNIHSDPLAKAQLAQYRRMLSAQKMGIRPPHVCGVMQMTEGDVQRSMNGLTGDLKRVASAERGLLTEETKLYQNQQLSGALDSKVASNAIREQKEQDLLAEFAKLRSEYGMLKTENDVIAANAKHTGVRLTSSSVTAKLKP